MAPLNTPGRKAAKKIKIRAYGPTLFLAGLVLLSIASATLIFAAPESQTTGQVTVSPGQVYTGDTIEISLRGFPAEFFVPAGLSIPLSCDVSGAVVTINATGLSSLKVCLTLYGRK